MRACGFVATGVAILLTAEAGTPRAGAGTEPQRIARLIQQLGAASITGPSGGYLNQTLTYTLGAAGEPANTTYTFTINWGDGSTQTVHGISGTTVTHSYQTSVSASISVTAAANGITSQPVYRYIYIAPLTVSAVPDPAQPGKETLVVTGTAATQYSTIYLTGTSSSVNLTFNYTALGNIALANSNIALVVVYAGGIDDEIYAAGLAVSSVLVGGGAGDYLYGGSAPNLLIAGPGSTTLHAGSAGDILIGGTTKYNNNLTALAYIMAEWGQTNVSYATRVGQLDGKLKSGLNGAYLLNSKTVSENNATDRFYGGAGLDWFFADLSGKHRDVVYGQTSGEVVTDI